MKYILVNDLKLIKQKKKMVLAYLIILLGYLLYNSLIGNKLNIDLVYGMFGLDCNFMSPFLDILMYIYSIVLFIYFALLIFDNDIKTNITNIFLRMNLKKWLLIKIISIINITLVIKLLSYAPIIFIYLINNVFTFEMINCLVINLIWIVSIEMLVLYVYILLKKVPYLLFIIIVVMLLNYKYLFFSFIAHSNYIFMALLINIILITMILLSSKRSICIFENINWR